MTIILQLPSVLRGCCNGQSELTISACTVGAMIQEVEQRYPSLYSSICDETGTVRRHINLFVNSSLVRRPGDLDIELAPGDVVYIFQAVSGG